MISILFILILVLFVGVLGVFGGGAFRWHGKQVKHSKFISRAITGIIFAYFLSFINPWFWLYLLWFPIGAAFGLGQPESLAINRWLLSRNAVMRSYAKGEEGAELEWWQWEWLRFHEFYSLAVRGVLYINPAHIVANPLAMWLALRTPYLWTMKEGRWHEAFHYSIALAITIGGVLWLTV